MTHINGMRQKPSGLFAGLSTIDLTYIVDDIPKRNSKVSASVQVLTAGGPATNAAVTFAFLGGKSALVSPVGQHPLTGVIRSDLNQFAVRLHDFAGDHTGAPPISSILVLPGGERTVISANAQVFPALDIRPDAQWFDEVDVVLVDGHHMPVCQTIAASGRSRGLDIVLDAGSWKEGTGALLSSVDIALCSDDFRPPGCQNEKDVFEFLTDHGIEQIAITRGMNSILYVDKGAAGEIAVERVNAIDTTGAGDIFHGAFCYQFSRQRNDFVGALSFAAQVATFSCLHVGTRSWMEPFRETLSEAPSSGGSR